jgi:predicted nucleic acid-binding protein
VKGFLIDTNIVSELRKGPNADTALAAWFAERNRRELFLSVVTLAELRRGIALIARRDSAHADTLRQWCDRVQRDYGRTGRLLPIRAAEAAAWGELMAVRPLPIMDGFLAATAQVHDLTLVTRNETDFAGLPLHIENPFSKRAV